MNVRKGVFNFLIIVCVSIFYSFDNVFADNYNTGEFPVIMYAVPASNKNFREVKSLGVNHVHLYGLTAGRLTNKKLQEVRKYLDLAHHHKLKVLLDLDGKRRVSSGRLEEMRVLVREFKDHPAIAYWYLFDEPNKIVSADKLMPYYNMIKKESPIIPIALCHLWSEKNWSTYNEVQDVVLYDIYPVRGERFPYSKLDNQTEFTRLVNDSSNDKEVIPVLQFFSWKSLKTSSISNLLKQYDYNDLRYPNYEEFRYLCFSSIAQGVDGLAFYSFLRAKMLDSDWIKNVASPVMREMVSFMSIVNNEKLKYSAISDNISDGYLLSYWVGEQENYIIMVNTTNQKKNITLKYKETFSGGDIETFGSTRDVSIKAVSNNLVIENVNPWEVIVLKQEVN